MDSGEGDRRDRRTRTHLKEAFLEALSDEKDSDVKTKRGITVTDLAETAEINRKTFYLHYKGLDALLSEIAEDIARTLDEKFNGDLEHDILVFYEFLSTDDAAVHRLLTSSEYIPFQRELYHDVFMRGAFGEYVKKSDYPEIVNGYFDCLAGLFYHYVKMNPEETDFTPLAANAAKLVLFGIRGGYSAAWSFLYQIYSRLCHLQSRLIRPAVRY